MKKKVAAIAIVSLIIVLLVLIGVGMWNTNKTQNENVNTDSVINEQTEKTYVQEFKTNEYSARVLESDNKEYLTLYIETNMFDNSKVVNVSYDFEKYMLDTANPLVANVERKENAGTKSFELELESLKTYMINFVKKNSNNMPAIDDISVN